MSLIVTGELYLASARQRCRRCRRDAPVLALAAHGLVHDGEAYGDAAGGAERGGGSAGGELLLLCDLSAMPAPVYALLHRRDARYRRQYCGDDPSRFYYGNHCRCGLEFHDVWLMSGTGAAFAPRDATEAAAIVLERLPAIGRLCFEGGCFHGAGDLIWRHARVA